MFTSGFIVDMRGIMAKSSGSVVASATEGLV